jgi:transposase-like protein
MLSWKGIYPEQIQQWRQACQDANTAVDPQPTKKRTAEQTRIKELERQLLRSDADRKEAVALLDLRKKAAAIWGKDKED